MANRMILFQIGPSVIRVDDAFFMAVSSISFVIFRIPFYYSFNKKGRWISKMGARRSGKDLTDRHIMS